MIYCSTDNKHWVLINEIFSTLLKKMGINVPIRAVPKVIIKSSHATTNTTVVWQPNKDYHMIFASVVFHLVMRDLNN